MVVEPQQLTVNGVQLHYHLVGDGPHSVLFIPGAAAPGAYNMFYHQMKYFGAEGSRYTAVCYDPRGYGHSRPPERELTIHPQSEHHIRKDASDAYELMKTLGHSEFSVVGWCDGGVVAVFLALQFPTAIKKIVLCGTRTHITEADVQNSKEWRNLKDWPNGTFSTHFIDFYGYECASEVWGRFADSVIAQLGQDVCSEEMINVKCPVLVVYGSQDKAVHRSHADHVINRIPDSKLKVFPDAGHCPFLTHSDEFNNSIDFFLKE